MHLVLFSMMLNVPQHLHLYVSQSHASSWFSTQGLDTVARTLKGTKQGDPLGDIIFNMIMSKVLRAIERRAKDAGIWEAFHIPSNMFTQALLRMCGSEFCPDNAFYVSYVDY